MSQHLQREIENLKKKILTLGAMVEDLVYKAALSIENRDGDLANEAMDNDNFIDSFEVEIEEDCLKILALHQPVAIDLRFIVAVLKINSDLERIGDLAVNIAERSAFLAKHDSVDISFDFIEMTQKAQAMLRQSLDALVNLSPSMARQVCSKDDEIDEMNRQMYVMVQQVIEKHPEQIGPLLHLLSVSRHLERIADHATNIAEDVIYMIEGSIVRHKIEEYE